MKVLFLCDRNVCRSQLAAAALRRLHPDWDVQSAGWSPHLWGAEIHWKTREVAWEVGLELGDRPRHWSEYAWSEFDVVVAFSAQAVEHSIWSAELVPIADPTPEGSRDDFIVCRDAILAFVEGRWGEGIDENGKV